MRKLCTLFLISLVSMNLIGQVNWTKHPDNPVLTAGFPGEWDEASVSPAEVIYLEGTYHMWYSGSRNDSTRIGHATSPDGITWAKDTNNPVLDVGPDGSWDAQNANASSVLFIDSVFHMWYNGDATSGGLENNKIGHATSQDGITWTKDPNNPVLTSGPEGAWDKYWSNSPTVVYTDGTFHMWYNGTENSSSISIGHATSPDGVTWTKDPQNPVITPSLDWEATYVFTGGTIFDGSTYRMWYSGGRAWETEIGYATSADGWQWDKYGPPVLGTGPAGSWEALYVGGSSVIFDSTKNTYKMWYYGTSESGWVGRGSIGYAESSDYVDIPDTAFLHALIDEGIDANGDSLISYEEAEAVMALDVSDKEIHDLTGMEAFFRLDTFNCSGNPFDKLDLSEYSELKVLICHSSGLKSLDVSGINSLKELDVSKNTALKELNCDFSQLTHLDVSENPAIERISCKNNRLISMDVSDLDSLRYLNCNKNQLTSLEVSGCDALRELFCFNNQLTSLDLCSNSSLESVYIGNNPSLDTVYVWETPFPPANVVLGDYGSPNIEFVDCSPSGWKKHKKDKFRLYPNPTHTLLTLENSNSDLITIVITSLNGSLMMVKELEGITHQIDLSSYRKGVYLITIRAKDFVTTRKIVKL